MHCVTDNSLKATCAHPATPGGRQRAMHTPPSCSTICRWLQQQSQVLAEAEAEDLHPLLATAVAALRDQPALLRYCADEVANARHSAMFQSFVVALTRGGPSNVPKAMDAHSKHPKCAVCQAHLCP